MNEVYHSARNSILYTLQHQERDNFFLLVIHIDQLMETDLKDYSTKAEFKDNIFNGKMIVDENTPVVEIHITPKEIDNYYIETYREAFRLSKKENIATGTIINYFNELNYISDKDKLMVYLERLENTPELLPEIIDLWEKGVFIEKNDYIKALSLKLAPFQTINLETFKLSDMLMKIMDEQEKAKQYIQLNMNLNKMNQDIPQPKV